MMTAEPQNASAVLRVSHYFVVIARAHAAAVPAAAMLMMLFFDRLDSL
jgi:hypothetical protein